MIDWESENWGGNVHLASNGSWVKDKHDDGDPNGESLAHTLHFA